MQISSPHTYPSGLGDYVRVFSIDYLHYPLLIALNDLITCPMTLIWSHLINSTASPCDKGCLSMTPNSIITFPPSEGSPPQSGNTHSSRHSYLTNEMAMETFHGLPGAEFAQPFIRKPTADNSRNERNSLGYSGLYQQEPYVEWHQIHPMACQYPKLQNSFQLSPSNDERMQSDVLIREPDENFVSEYTWPQYYEPGVPMPDSIEPGFASGYFVHSPQQNCANGLTNLDGLDNIILDSPTEHEQLSISHSPKMGIQISSNTSSGFRGTPTLVDTSSSKASDNGEGDSGDGNLSTVEERISDAPYAKLIYKALMEAPNHSMVLQDIYQWFIDNTGKGSSVSTGWRNSIRHNLSMNAVSDSRQEDPHILRNLGIP
jgi:hypothetical protein